MNAFSTLPRAFASNLRTIAATPAGQAELGAHGISEPTIQRYVLWRRATVLMVVIATVLSAAVSTFSTFTESDDEPNVVASVTETLHRSSKPPFRRRRNSPSPARRRWLRRRATTPAGRPANEPQTAMGRVVDGVHLLSLYAMPIAALIVLFLGWRFRLAYRA